MINKNKNKLLKTQIPYLMVSAVIFANGCFGYKALAADDNGMNNNIPNFYDIISITQK